MLRISKGKVSVEHEPKFKELLDKGLISDTGNSFELTRKGKCYISDIHLFLMRGEERMKLKVFEVTSSLS
jgi:predicted transcriptional regulator